MYRSKLFCFICLSYTNPTEMKDISTIDETEQSIADKLKIFHPEIDPVEENIKKFMCLCCIEELDKSLNFKTKYNNAQKCYSFYINSFTTPIISKETTTQTEITEPINNTIATDAIKTEVEESVFYKAPVEENIKKFLCLCCIEKLDKPFNFKTKYNNAQQCYSFNKNIFTAPIISKETTTQTEITEPINDAIVTDAIKNELEEIKEEDLNSSDLEMYKDVKTELLSQPDPENSTQTSTNTTFCNAEENCNFPCFYCSANFTSQATLEEHLKLHESSLEEKRQNRLKQRQTMRPKSERQIVAKRQRVNGLHCCKLCAKCNMKSPASDAKKSNIVTCHLCDISFNTDDEFARHKCTLFYQCKICLKKFRSKSNLLKHNITHKKIHKCTRCPRSFVTESLLREHFQIHTKSDDKTFKK